MAANMAFHNLSLATPFSFLEVAIQVRPHSMGKELHIQEALASKVLPTPQERIGNGRNRLKREGRHASARADRAIVRET